MSVFRKNLETDGLVVRHVGFDSMRIPFSPAGAFAEQWLMLYQNPCHCNFF